MRKFSLGSNKMNTGSESYVALGRKYEELTQGLLDSLGIETRLVGGSQDGGIDLRGHWRLSKSIAATPLIVQCKRIGRQAGCPPSYLRELEGSLGLCGENTLGVMVCSQPATKATSEAIMRSPKPIMYLHFDEIALRRAFVNGAVQRLIPGLVLATKHRTGGTIEPAFFYRD